MEYYFAPMEGVTGAEYRAVHHRHFPGVDRYYMPFITPTQDRVFTPRELPEHRAGAQCRLLRRAPAADQKRRGLQLGRWGAVGHGL